LLLREVEKRPGIIAQSAACFRDHRKAERIEHSNRRWISFCRSGENWPSKYAISSPSLGRTGFLDLGPRRSKFRIPLPKVS